MNVRLYLSVCRTLALVLATSLIVFGVPAKQLQGGARVRQPNAAVPSSLIRVGAVVIRDGDKFVTGLTPKNFTVEEDGVPQRVLTADHYSAVNGGTSGKIHDALKLFYPNVTENLKGLRPILLHHRLILLYFDLTSLTAAELQSSVHAGLEFVEQQMTTSDLVAVVSFGGGLTSNVNFTNNKDFLKSGLTWLSLARDSVSAGNDTSLCPKDASYCEDLTQAAYGFDSHHITNRSTALSLVTAALMTIPGKKSIVHFAGDAPHANVLDPGLTADLANFGLVSFYEVDVREPVRSDNSGPSAEDSAGSTLATAPQESLPTLARLAQDTGGSFYTNVNDFRPIFQKVQQDTKEYYLLTCNSSTPKYDGSLRKLSVKLVSVPGSKLTFRPISFRVPGFEFD